MVLKVLQMQGSEKNVFLFHSIPFPFVNVSLLSFKFVLYICVTEKSKKKIIFPVHGKVMVYGICQNLAKWNLQKKKEGGEEGEGQNNTVYWPKIMSEKTTEIHNWGCKSSQRMPKPVCMREFSLTFKIWHRFWNGYE